MLRCYLIWVKSEELGDRFLMAVWVAVRVVDAEVSLSKTCICMS